MWIFVVVSNDDFVPALDDISHYLFEKHVTGMAMDLRGGSTSGSNTPATERSLL